MVCVHFIYQRRHCGSGVVGIENECGPEICDQLRCACLLVGYLSVNTAKVGLL